MLMGKSILQIPESRPTELLVVDFSLLERDMYQGNREQLAKLREMAKTSDVPRGKRMSNSSSLYSLPAATRAIGSKFSLEIHPSLSK